MDPVLILALVAIAIIAAGGLSTGAAPPPVPDPWPVDPSGPPDMGNLVPIPGDPLTPILPVPSLPAGLDPVPIPGTPNLPTTPTELAGEPHFYDNEIAYATQAVGFTDPFAPYAVKAIIAKESGWNPIARGDHKTCIAIDPNAVGCCGPYMGDGYFTGYASVGLMQVNRCAHPDLATEYDLRDANQNIYAGCVVLLGVYQAGDWIGTLARYNGSGPEADAYAASVLPVAQSLAAQDGVSMA